MSRTLRGRRGDSQTTDAAPDAGTVLRSKKTAVLVVDFQHDFCEGGALGVPGANEEYRSDMCKAIAKLRSIGAQLCFSQDWHPQDHMSFASNNPGKQVLETVRLQREDSFDQIMWPDHCVQGSYGAELIIPPLPGEHIQKKGTRRDFDSYSAFCDDGGQKTGLEDTLKKRGVDTIVCFGLATDFCVNFTAWDAAVAGFKIFWVPELCRGISPDFNPEEEYAEKGALEISLATILAEKP